MVVDVGGQDLGVSFRGDCTQATAGQWLDLSREEKVRNKLEPFNKKEQADERANYQPQQRITSSPTVGTQPLKTFARRNLSDRLMGSDIETASG